MGGVEKYFLKFYDICKFQKLELSTRGRGLRTPWPDPPTPVKIRTCMYPQWITFSCALGRRIYFVDDVLSCFFIILCHEECFFFFDFSIEYVYCYLFSIVNTPSKRFFNLNLLTMWNWEKYSSKCYIIVLTTLKYKEKSSLLQWMIDKVSSSIFLCKYFLQALETDCRQ